MARRYQHIKELLPIIKKMLENGKTQKEIEEKLGLAGDRPIHNLLKRERRKERENKIEAKRGRPCKANANEIPPSIQRLDKLSQMRYVMASKDRYIKRLEMENELMRDFLLLTERK